MRKKKLMLKSFSNCHNCFDGCLKETERIIDSEVEQMPKKNYTYTKYIVKLFILKKKKMKFKKKIRSNLNSTVKKVEKKKYEKRRTANKKKQSKINIV